MELKEAIEIVESLGVINVNYKGKPIWIESISSESGQIRVKDLKTNEEFIVDSSELSET